MFNTVHDAAETFDSTVSEGVANVLSDITGIQAETFQSIINLVVTVLVIFIILRFLENVILKGIRKKSKNTKIAEAKLTTITKMLDGFFKFLTALFIIVQVLIAAGVDTAQIIAVTSALSVALGFAAQGVVKDLINGIIIIIEDQYKLGDFCEINGYKGEVEKLTIRVTQLRDVDGCIHIIPNSCITEVTTMSKDYIKAIVVVGVEYGADIDWILSKLESLMEDVYNEMPDKLLAIPFVRGICEFNDSSVDIKIICDAAIGERVNVEYALRLRIKQMFDREGIVIPFPQRDVNFINAKE